MENFKLLKKRIGNIEVTNYYDDGKKKVPTQSHIKEYSNFSCFEILYYTPNPHYGKEKDYIKEGSYYIPKIKTINKYSIHEDCFKHPESSFVLAFIKINYKEYEATNIQSVGNRPMELKPYEQLIFNELAHIGYKFIVKELYKLNKDK